MGILTKVTVAGQAQAARVVVKNVNGGLQQTNKVNPVSLIASAEGASQRFDQLIDVVEGTPGNGDIVTYNAATDTYTVKPIANIEMTMDGGTF